MSGRAALISVRRSYLRQLEEYPLVLSLRPDKTYRNLGRDIVSYTRNAMMQTHALH